MLDLDPNRAAVPPKDAATLVLVRDRGDDIEVFYVERHQKSRFMGGALVFPGGKVDPSDGEDAWLDLTTPPRPASFAEDPGMLRALAIAACRETLEEAAMLPTQWDVRHEELLALRKRIAAKTQTLQGYLRHREIKLDLAALHPLARWITPTPESRRYDTRFFITAVGAGQRGAHDEHETTASFWATPTEVLGRFAAGSVQLAPPTQRTIELLAQAHSADEALALADRACKDPICPRLVRHDDTVALVLPGDPEHEVPTPRIAGPSRFVLRGVRWVPEPPHQRPSR